MMRRRNTAPYVILLLSLCVAFFFFKSNCTKSTSETKLIQAVSGSKAEVIKEQNMEVASNEYDFKKKADSLNKLVTKLVTTVNVLFDTVASYQQEIKQLTAVKKVNSNGHGNEKRYEYVIDTIREVALVDSMAKLNGLLLEQTRLYSQRDSFNAHWRQAYNKEVVKNDSLISYIPALKKKAARGKWGWRAAALAGGALILKTIIKK